MYVCTDKHCNGIGPRYGGVLAPPPRHNDGHVEAEHKGERDEVRVRRTVLDYSLEYPAGGGGRKRERETFE